jgi:hypothetical protein
VIANLEPVLLFIHQKIEDFAKMVLEISFHQNPAGFVTTSIIALVAIYVSPPFDLFTLLLTRKGNNGCSSQV